MIYILRINNIRGIISEILKIMYQFRGILWYVGLYMVLNLKGSLIGSIFVVMVLLGPERFFRAISIDMYVLFMYI